MRCCGITMGNIKGCNNDAWRGNGPVKGTTFTKYSLEDVEFLRANSHLTPKQAAEALSVKYGQPLKQTEISNLAKRHGIKMANGKFKANRGNSARTPHDTFYVTPEFLTKKYKLPPVLENKYSNEEKKEE